MTSPVSASRARLIVTRKADTATAGSGSRRRQRVVEPDPEGTRPSLFARRRSEPRPTSSRVGRSCKWPDISAGASAPTWFGLSGPPLHAHASLADRPRTGHEDGQVDRGLRCRTPRIRSAGSPACCELVRSSTASSWRLSWSMRRRWSRGQPVPVDNGGAARQRWGLREIEFEARGVPSVGLSCLMAALSGLPVNEPLRQEILRASSLALLRAAAWRRQLDHRRGSARQTGRGTAVVRAT